MLNIKQYNVTVKSVFAVSAVFFSEQTTMWAFDLHDDNAFYADKSCYSGPLKVAGTVIYTRVMTDWRRDVCFLFAADYVFLCVYDFFLPFRARTSCK